MSRRAGSVLPPALTCCRTTCGKTVSPSAAMTVIRTYYRRRDDRVRKWQDRDADLRRQRRVRAYGAAGTRTAIRVTLRIASGRAGLLGWPVAGLAAVGAPGSRGAGALAYGGGRAGRAVVGCGLLSRGSGAA